MKYFDGNNYNTFLSLFFENVLVYVLGFRLQPGMNYSQSRFYSHVLVCQFCVRHVYLWYCAIVLMRCVLKRSIRETGMTMMFLFARSYLLICIVSFRLPAKLMEHVSHV